MKGIFHHVLSHCLNRIKNKAKLRKLFNQHQPIHLVLNMIETDCEQQFVSGSGEVLFKYWIKENILYVNLLSMQEGKFKEKLISQLEKKQCRYCLYLETDCIDFNKIKKQIKSILRNTKSKNHQWVLFVNNKNIFIKQSSFLSSKAFERYKNVKEDRLIKDWFFEPQKGVSLTDYCENAIFLEKLFHLFDTLLDFVSFIENNSNPRSKQYFVCAQFENYDGYAGYSSFVSQHKNKKYFLCFCAIGICLCFFYAGVIGYQTYHLNKALVLVNSVQSINKLSQYAVWQKEYRTKWGKFVSPLIQKALFFAVKKNIENKGQRLFIVKNNTLNQWYQFIRNSSIQELGEISIDFLRDPLGDTNMSSTGTISSFFSTEFSVHNLECLFENLVEKTELLLVKKKLNYLYEKDKEKAWAAWLKQINFHSFADFEEAKKRIKHFVELGGELSYFLDFLELQCASQFKNHMHSESSFIEIYTKGLVDLLDTYHSKEKHTFDIQHFNTHFEKIYQNLLSEINNYVCSRYAMGISIELKRVLQKPLEEIHQLIARDLFDHITVLWQKQVLPFYESRLKGHYPFEKYADDCKETDFVDFFNPESGVFIGFVEKYLEPYFIFAKDYVFFAKKFENVIENAKEVAGVFFNKKNRELTLELEIKILPAAKRKKLELKFYDQHIIYTNGPTQWLRIRVPEQASSQKVFLKGTFLDADRRLLLRTESFEGRFAMLRFLEANIDWFKIANENEACQSSVNNDRDVQCLIKNNLPFRALKSAQKIFHLGLVF